MWIRGTTRGSSPLTMDRGVVGIRFPVLLSATGRAYLAYCAEQQRELILDHLARSAEPGAELARDGKRTAGLLGQTRSQRFGHRCGEREPPAGSGAVAVPVRDGQGVLGCTNVTFAAKAVRPHEAAVRHLHALTRAAARIAADRHHDAGRAVRALRGQTGSHGGAAAMAEQAPRRRRLRPWQRR